MCEHIELKKQESVEEIDDDYELREIGEDYNG